MGAMLILSRRLRLVRVAQCTDAVLDVCLDEPGENVSYAKLRSL